MRRRVRRIACTVGLAVVVGACSPGVAVRNGTSDPIRVVVSGSSGIDAFAALPGQRVVTHVGEGAFRAAVVSDTDWRAYASALQITLDAQLARPDTMSADETSAAAGEIDAIGRHLIEVATAAPATGQCQGTAMGNAGATVEVSAGTNGGVTLACH
jgi:hypothetical protein